MRSLLQIGILRVREVIYWEPQSRYAAQSHPLHTSYHGPVAEEIWLNQKMTFLIPKICVIAFQQKLELSTGAWAVAHIHQPWNLLATRTEVCREPDSGLHGLSHIPFSRDHHRSSAPLLLKSSILTWHPATNVILWHLRALCETKFRRRDEASTTLAVI